MNFPEQFHCNSELKEVHVRAVLCVPSLAHGVTVQLGIHGRCQLVFHFPPQVVDCFSELLAEQLPSVRIPSFWSVPRYIHDYDKMCRGSYSLDCLQYEHYFSYM